MKRLLLISAMVAALMLGSLAAWADCGTRFAQPMLDAGFKTKTSAARFEAAEASFRQALNHHSPVQWIASDRVRAAAVAFVVQSELRSNFQLIAEFEGIVDWARGYAKSEYLDRLVGSAEAFISQWQRENFSEPEVVIDPHEVSRADASREIDATFSEGDRATYRSFFEAELARRADLAWEESETRRRLRATVANLQRKLAFLDKDVEPTGRIDPVTQNELRGTPDSGALDRMLTEQVQQHQRNLNLAGFQLVEDGEPGPYTRGATETFQRSRNLPPTGRLDSETRALLQEETQRVLTELAQGTFHLGVDREPLAYLREINREVRGEESHTYDDRIQAWIGERLADYFTSAREQLASLAYPAPAGNDPAAWRDALRSFQVDQGLDASGRLDADTRERLRVLCEEFREPPIPLQTTPAEMAERLDGAAAELADRSLSPSDDVAIFEVRRELGQQITRTFNALVGEDLVALEPNGKGQVILTVVDTLGYGLDAKVREVIETDKLGIALADANGVVIYSPWFDQESGRAVVQVSTPDGTLLQEVSPSAGAFWNRLGDLLGMNNARRQRQAQTMDHLVRRAVADRQVLVVREGALEFPFESMVRLPVFRSVDRTKSTEEIVAKVAASLRTGLRPDNTYVLSALPTDEAQHHVLKERARLEGEWESTWRRPVGSIHDAFRRMELEPDLSGELPPRAVRKRLKKALRKKDNVLVLVAHANGETIFLPTSEGIIPFHAEELNDIANEIRENRPTVLLLACKTGQTAKTGQTEPDTKPFARRLVALGANLVIAPSATIDVPASQAVIERLLTKGAESSLAEAVMDIYWGASETELERPLTLFVHKESLSDDRLGR